MVRASLLAILIALAAGFACTSVASAAIVITPGTPPVQPGTSYSEIIRVAKQELVRGAAERRGNNVPRYHRGRGKVAPYSIRDAWCVAFATWVWSQAGFDDYLGTRALRTAHGGTVVAVQVSDLTRWAKRTGHFSTRAKPGYLVAYGGTHIGIVQRADRRGRAVKSIEGNLTDKVSEVTVSMPSVTGYISPDVITGGQRSLMRSLRPDM